MHIPPKKSASSTPNESDSAPRLAAGDSAVTLPGEFAKSYQEDQRTIDFELLGVAVVYLSVFALFVAGVLPAGWYVLAAATLGIRAFILYHDRVHSRHSRAIPLLSKLVDFFPVPCIPHQELAAEHGRRHLRHHLAHNLPPPRHDVSPHEDPHVYFQAGSWYRALVLSFMYDEVMLWHDLTREKVVWNRQRSLHLIYSAAFFIPIVHLFGWRYWLIPIAAVKLGQGLGYFYFSYVLHQPLFFDLHCERQHPLWFRSLTRINSWLFGRRTAQSVLFHKAHHLHPKVRNSLLRQLNEALLSNEAKAAGKTTPANSRPVDYDDVA